MDPAPEPVGGGVNAGEGVEKRQPSYTIGRNVIGTVTMENSMEFPLKTKNRAAI